MLSFAWKLPDSCWYLDTVERNETEMRRAALQFLFFLGVINFAVFWIIGVYLGGDALGGKAVDGRYFLGNRGHLTEVSRAVFTYSQWHARSVFVTFPIAILSKWFLRREAKGRNSGNT